MASNIVKSNKMKRMESKKTYSWWWDSHVSPKNSKWLQDNLEDMDQHVKRMLKLIEEDADSFAKKAEMYYQKRPELISLVEDFYRMYRSLAERYDHVTGELKKNIPSDLQSQCSGISDLGSEPPSAMASPDRRPLSQRKSGPRAAGFEFFLGNGGGPGSDICSMESESESDDEEDSSVNNYSGNDEEQGLRTKIIELEVELREVKEKLQSREVADISEGHFGQFSDEKKGKYEEQLRVAKEEIGRLTIELRKYASVEDNTEVEQNQESVMDGSEGEVVDSVDKIQTLEEELRITQDKLRDSEEEITRLRQELTSKGSSIENLQDELKMAEKELEKEKREVLKLQERVTRYKTNLSDRDQEIRVLKEAMSNANKTLSEENEQLRSEITRISKERASLEDNLKELDFRCQSLQEDVRRKAEAEVVFGSQIDDLKADLAEKNEIIEGLKKNIEDLNTKIDALVVEVSSKDDHIDEMNKHLHQLHMEHVDLIGGAEVARKSIEELRWRIKELEREVEKKEEIIIEGAEEKREAIRQLCFSLEHYRNGYHRLRQAVVGHKGLPVIAS
ncbi:hypothetical protein ABFS82_04G080100 [Erythranthe guttata]|uniref:NAB domain-containing protein n=1 Tax=Erythranthe guttata TaxID=4155 RepID=A0A022RZS9_ERYGU|nr:PREDICTED: protein NETWORKED 4B [Erythranthe guttata]EYU46027.1 hypothetical protein MIMGU_mgv1a003826mg [Erythranthe guttata]|eukprot:XP_012842269.1 PREDICTED: protein NETWORKED 4B [Erythranthe guttata]